MHRRTRRTLLIVAAVLVLLAVAAFLRSKAPPEAARLLPEADGIIYINLRPFRAFGHKSLKPPNRVPEYQEFVDATGVDWENDLDQVAIALHRMPNPSGPNGPVAYSLVLVGKITGSRLNSWLDAHATSREVYAGHTVYSVASENRTVRVAQIGYDTLAISNTPTEEQIHSMIDRHRTAALPFANSTLLRDHYHEVPLLSLVWGIGQIGLPFSESGAIKIFGFSLPLEDGATIIASVTPSLPIANSLRLRVEEIAPSEQEAASQAASLATLVTLARGYTMPLGDNAPNNALRELLRTTAVTQHKDRVVISGTVTSSLLAQVASGAANPQIPATAAPPAASK
jgi:hypothetical protein